MIAIKFSKFYSGDYDDDGFELYVIKDSDRKVMYIGVSRDSIWLRWFGGGTSHMDMNTDGKIYGRSYIGEVIERRLPNSWDWVIELWTKEDCLKTLGEEFEGKDGKRINIEALEPYMINKFEPLYNVMYSSGSHEDPLTTKKLDEAYKKLFG